MIKKYCSLTLIAATLAVVGCSSSDDNGSGDGEVTTNPVDTGEPQGPVAVVVPTEFEPAEGVSLNIAETLIGADGIETFQGATFTSLVNAAISVDLDGALAGAGPLTIFAPSDAAFQAFADAGGVLPTSAEGDVLSDILQGHIVNGALDGTLVVASEGQNVEALNGNLLAITNVDGQFSVGGAPISITDIQATNGIIHVIDTVIASTGSSEEPPTDGGDGEGEGEGEGGGDGGGDGGTGELGASLDGLNGAGFTDYVTIYNNTDPVLGTSLDVNPWTAFVPTNDALSDADVALTGSGAFDLVADNLLTDGAFDAQALLDLGSIAANGGATLTFTGSADALLVNGFSATPIESSGAATLFAIDGVITQ